MMTMLGGVGLPASGASAPLAIVPMPRRDNTVTRIVDPGLETVRLRVARVGKRDEHWCMGSSTLGSAPGSFDPALSPGRCLGLQVEGSRCCRQAAKFLLVPDRVQVGVRGEQVEPESAA